MASAEIWQPLSVDELKSLFKEATAPYWLSGGPKIRGPAFEFSWTDANGLKILSPVIQLLYKSKSPRDKDLLDLQNCLPHLDSLQKNRLKELILIDTGQDHPWLEIV